MRAGRAEGLVPEGRARRARAFEQGIVEEEAVVAVTGTRQLGPAAVRRQQTYPPPNSAFVSDLVSDRSGLVAFIGASSNVYVLCFMYSSCCLLLTSAC